MIRLRGTEEESAEGVCCGYMLGSGGNPVQESTVETPSNSR